MHPATNPITYSPGREFRRDEFEFPGTTFRGTGRHWLGHALGTGGGPIGARGACYLPGGSALAHAALAGAVIGPGVRNHAA